MEGESRTYIVPNVVESYGELLEDIYHHGAAVRPRDKLTFEIRGLTVVSKDPTTHKLVEDRTFIESEIRTVLSGDPPDVRANSELVERLDLEEDGTFFEKGIRDAISHNWDDWVHRLRKMDAASRKCAAVFTHPRDPDPPCTMFIQFLVRGGEVHLFTLNRSQDMFFAYPMDMELFETLQCRMAKELSEVNPVGVGGHWHTMISAHIYEEQLDEIRELWDG